MNIKLIGVKYPKAGYGFKPCQDKQCVVVNVDEDIKQIIKTQLFANDKDYVLINYNGTMYICEKLDGEQYTKRQVNYHPLQHLVQ